MDIEKIKERIKKRGPDRVVVDAGGTAVTPNRALMEYGLVPDMVFIRSDGWSLGAPSQFRQVAFKMWDDEWVSFLPL